MMHGAANRGRQAFRLKGTMPALSTLCLLTEDLEAIERQLVDHLSQMPQFFLHAPVLVDLQGLTGGGIDLGRLAETLRRNHLVPVAVRNPTEEQRQRAIEAGWGVLQNQPASPRASAEASSEGSQASAPAASAGPARTPRPPAVRQAPEPVVEAAEPSPAGLTVRSAVRSGQVVRAVGGDLVVLAAVSSGAELIADGNIHVYAALRGRALAGAQDPRASIFCMALEAEFLCIDGYYLMAEEIPKEHWGRPARVHLEGEQLVVTRL